MHKGLSPRVAARGAALVLFSVLFFHSSRRGTHCHHPHRVRAGQAPTRTLPGAPDALRAAPASLPEVLELVIAEQHGRHRRPGESGGVAFLRRQVRGTFMGLFQATKGSRQQPVAVSGWSAAVDRTC